MQLSLECFCALMLAKLRLLAALLLTNSANGAFVFTYTHRPVSLAYILHLWPLLYASLSAVYFLGQLVVRGTLSVCLLVSSLCLSSEHLSLAGPTRGALASVCLPLTLASNCRARKRYDPIRLHSGMIKWNDRCKERCAALANPAHV